jgi:hypothetical protein
MQPYDSIDVVHRNYGPGSYVATSTVHRLDLPSPSE